METTKIKVGNNTEIEENVLLGYLPKVYKENVKTIIGNNSIVRYGSIIYADVKIGDNFRSGHNILIRENTKIGNNVLVGTNSIIDGSCTLGDNISIQSNVYIPTYTKIGNNVFLGPCATLINDKYPIRGEYNPHAPEIYDNVTIGANTTILPGIKIGKGSVVAAGSVVTKNVPSWKLAVGNPAKIKELPERMKTKNKI